MIAFRADANQTVATGHIMRCLSIAAAIREMGEETAFFTADEAGADLVRAQGFPATVLQTDWRDMESELPVLLPLLSQCKIEAVVVDSYRAAAGYLRALCARAKTAYMDDLNAFFAPVDMLINYNVYASQASYAARYADARLLLGCGYAPLRAQFRDIEPTCRERVRDVLLTTGGADGANAAYTIAKALPQTVRVHLVAGRLQTHRNSLEQLARERGNITIHQDVSDMAGLMRACDIAVSAGGSTLYELCACGLPTVLFTVADNQLPAAAAFGERNMMICAGDIRDGAACIARVCAGVAAYQADAALRRARSAAMRKLVDGNGAVRIARALMELCGR